MRLATQDLKRGNRRKSIRQELSEDRHDLCRFGHSLKFRETGKISPHRGKLSFSRVAGDAPGSSSGLQVVFKMPYSISTVRHFSAGHQLAMYDGSLEPLHEHDWVVKVTVASARLDQIGVVMDFHELERRIDTLLAPMRDRRLNDLPAFTQRNPSAEQVARHIADGLSLPAGVTLSEVEVWETPDNSASYRP